MLLSAAKTEGDDDDEEDRKKGDTTHARGFHGRRRRRRRRSLSLSLSLSLSEAPGVTPSLLVLSARESRPVKSAGPGPHGRLVLVGGRSC
jgi:hypothetical protein